MLLFKKSPYKNSKLIAIDFTKPWWYLILDQKRLALPIIGIIIAANTFWGISPFLITWMFELTSVSACLTLFACWFLIDCSYAAAIALNTQFQLQCIHSIYYNAHQHLLTIDPRYHIHRSSGAILGKIDRAARGCEDLLDQIVFEFIPLLVGLIAMVIAVSYYSLWLAYGIIFFFIIMIVAGYYFAQYACQPWEKEFIETDDAFRSSAVENLAQVQLVRATFASDYMSHTLTQKIKTNMHTEGALWLAYTAMRFILNMAYLISLFCLLSVLSWQINYSITSLAAAISLAIAYIRNTKDLVKIANPFRRYMRGLAAVKDLFAFMSTFGKQGYPVLGHASRLATKGNVITIEAHAISFDYATAYLFNNHTFSLSCTAQQPNKLYGIIGPSGSGKTTFLSILGGQLKPILGTVCINGTDIYTVNDAVRKQLIALQGQVATNVQGTVKYNLLFGLPEDHSYNDGYLLTLLERVGLRTILTTYQGLETMLGEGGLNLSGGQRQRLNFAGLYLRARYYHPLLILIDEPTSSLDELSEAAITEMILELAHTAITLVIAHRLKTVQNAIALIDLSLLDKEKNIIAYSPIDLQERSPYYRQLAQGNIQLD